MITLSNVNKSFTVYKKAKSTLFKRERTTIHALKDITLEIGKGEIIGYIGPNGAGKSTTIKIMGGILTPDSGTCTILGRVPHRERKEHVRHIGVVFGQRSSLWWDVPVIDSYELIRDIYGIDENRFRHNVGYLGEILGFSELLRTPVRQLSLGQRIRCEIAASLLHDPEILFLDEPTIGLDAVSKLAVRKFIKDINAEKQATVILTTHDMNDIDALATRVMLIGNGELTYDGTFEDIKQKYNGNRVMTIRFEPALDALPLRLMSANVLSQNENAATISFDPAVARVPQIISEISNSRTLLDFSVAEPPIEEIMAFVYKEMRL